ncbi:hypothetical protein LQZ19_09520 [Treponema primitia]|uniref:hypothetical protein n=1 Tax=Treponema primitia TaxID=88058 RepID=UPI00397F8C86
MRQIFEFERELRQSQELVTSSGLGHLYQSVEEGLVGFFFAKAEGLTPEEIRSKNETLRVRLRQLGFIPLEGYPGKEAAGDEGEYKIWL